MANISWRISSFLLVLIWIGTGRVDAEEVLERSQRSTKDYLALLNKDSYVLLISDQGLRYLPLHLYASISNSGALKISRNHTGEFKI